jgi:CTP:molybdopterin cytidylyltransferase MocA
VKVAGVLLGGGRSSRFGAPKLEAEVKGERLIDASCAHFLAAGLEPVVFCGSVRPADPRVVVVAGGATMIETLRSGLAALPEGPFAFAPADMPALCPDLVRSLLETFLAGNETYLVPCHAGRRGHPAFARSAKAFFRLGDREGPREVWREAGGTLRHEEVETADVLFDIDTPEDLAAAEDEESRRARLLSRGDLRC